MRRIEMPGDVGPASLADMPLPSDPYVGFHRGRISVDDETFDRGETLVVASDRQQRRYLLKRWDGGRHFKAYQITPVENEKLRLLNVYRVMIGQPVENKPGKP